MSATTTVLDAPTAGAALPEPRVTQRRVVRSEWIKFRSVRSNLIGIGAAGAAMVLFGVLFSSLADSGTDTGPTPAGADPVTYAFSGINLAQLVIGVLAAVLVTSEYTSGMIRSTYAAVVTRLPVLWGKTIVAAGVTGVVMTVAGLAAFLTGTAVYSGTEAVPSIGDPGVIRAVLGVGVYAAAIAVMGVALGFLLRRTAAAIGTLVASIMVAPVLAGLLPGETGSTIASLLPSNAGRAVMSVADDPDLLSPGAGLAVLLAWVVVAVGAAAWSVRRRDA